MARTASKISEIMGYDKVICDKMYLAGTLHDVGKIAIGNEILEKPARLTDEEFAKMKNHAGYTYMILSRVDGFEEMSEELLHFIMKGLTAAVIRLVAKKQRINYTSEDNGVCRYISGIDGKKTLQRWDRSR